MKFRLTSFRLRIILTLIIVISVFTSAAIVIYNNILLDRIYARSEQNIKNILQFLKAEVINVHDGRLIKPLLENFEKDSHVIHAFLMDENGNIKYPPPDHKIEESDTVDFHRLIRSGSDIEVEIYRSQTNPTSLAFLRIHNGPECFQCHSQDKRTLGYVAMRVSLDETQSILGISRKFIILFTLLMIIIIMSFVMVLHYRFIRRSLARFRETIGSINQGDLDKRVDIRESSELATLGFSFNQMLDNFQLTRRKLENYHQKELESAEKLASIGEMAARLAHDVRNPLTGISNAIEIIAADMQDSPNLPVIEEIRRQSDRVNLAISNLLKYARSAEIRTSRGNIHVLLQNISFFLLSQNQNHKVSIHLEPDPGLPEMDFDAIQMENVLMNICINAIQAMRNEGIINISTSLDRAGQNVVIAIEDNGPGIPDNIRENIFKPFFTTRTEGTGLGLAIAKDIIEKHRGRIWFESTQKVGTIFYVSLPIYPATEGNEI